MDTIWDAHHDSVSLLTAFNILRCHFANSVRFFLYSSGRLGMVINLVDEEDEDLLREAMEIHPMTEMK